MKTITKDKVVEALKDAIDPKPVDSGQLFIALDLSFKGAPWAAGRLVSVLISQPAFVALAQTGGGFYRAQFGPAEAQAKDPLEALSIAFLKDKGYEVVE